MSKVIVTDFRQTKVFKLPVSGVEVECYSSILVKDLNDLTQKKEGENLNLEVVLKVIKSWNLFDKETDENPMPVNAENFSKIPAPDFQYLVKELEVFASEVKKN